MQRVCSDLGAGPNPPAPFPTGEGGVWLPLRFGEAKWPEVARLGEGSAPKSEHTPLQHIA
jgi:hypothetical protein